MRKRETAEEGKGVQLPGLGHPRLHHTQGIPAPGNRGRRWGILWSQRERETLGWRGEWEGRREVGKASILAPG